MNDHPNQAPSTLSLDKYRHHIAHLGLSHERQTEMIEALHAFLSGFVDRAFGHDPIQLAAGDRLQLSDDGPTPSVLGPVSA